MIARPIARHKLKLETAIHLAAFADFVKKGNICAQSLQAVSLSDLSSEDS